MARPKVWKGPCRSPECGKPVVARGLCITCYMQAQRMVRKGKVTWDELENLGVSIPRTRPKGSTGGYSRLHAVIAAAKAAQGQQ